MADHKKCRGDFLVLSIFLALYMVLGMYRNLYVCVIIWTSRGVFSEIFTDFAFPFKFLFSLLSVPTVIATSGKCNIK